MVGTAIKEKIVNTHEFGVSSAEVLSAGVELRSFDTLNRVGKLFGRYSKIKGGVSKALLSLEYFPSHIIDNFARNSPWRGFINISDYRQFSFSDVIFVRTETLWSPAHFWILFSEIARLLINRTSDDFFSNEHPLFKEFLSNKLYEKWWLGLVLDMFIDALAFSIGFFNNFDMFMKVTWQYLYEYDYKEQGQEYFESRFARTFFVEL